MRKVFMKYARHRMVGQASIYLSASFLKAGLGFIVLPIYSHLLSPSQYGLWSIWVSVKSLFEKVVCVGQNSLLAKYYHKENVRDFRTRLSASFFITALACVLVLLCMLPFAYQFPTLWGIEAKYYLMIPLIVVALNGLAINATLLRHEGKAWQFFSFETVGAVLTPAAGMFLVYYNAMDWHGLLYGSIIATLVLWVWAIKRLLTVHGINWGIDRVKLKEQLLLGAPLILHSLNVVVLTSSDRLILAQMMGDAAVGIYTINYKVGMTIQIVTLALASTLVPWVYRQLTEPTHQKRLAITYVNIVYALGMVMLATFIAMAGPLAVRLLFNPAYHHYQEVIGWTAFGGLWHALYSLFIGVLIFFDKNKIVMWTSVFATVLNIVATIVLVHLWGVVGAAIATFISYFFTFTVIWYYTEKTFPLPWKEGFLRLMKLKLK